MKKCHFYLYNTVHVILNDVFPLRDLYTDGTSEWVGPMYSCMGTWSELRARKVIFFQYKLFFRSFSREIKKILLFLQFNFPKGLYCYVDNLGNLKHKKMTCIQSPFEGLLRKNDVQKPRCPLGALGSLEWKQLHCSHNFNHQKVCCCCCPDIYVCSISEVESLLCENGVEFQGQTQCVTVMVWGSQLQHDFPSQMWKK